jgi:3',5'-cyclic-AMP phosphodiesterase
LEGRYTAMFEETPGLLMSLHAHIHELKDGYPYNDGIRYLATGSFDKRSFVLIKIWSGQVDTRVIEY